MIKTVIVFVEGQTEEAFIKDVVAPSLYSLNIFLEPRLLKTSPTSKGGDISFDRLKRYTRNTLKERSDTYLTTFFDLYGLGRGFPDYESIMKLKSPLDKSRTLELKIHEKLVSEFKFRADRFFPHIQPYEYEGLLFSDIDQLVMVEPAWERFSSSLMKIRGDFDTPEHINNSYHTKPSSRLEQTLVPRYRKTMHGPQIARKIGLVNIEKECPHFQEWMNKLRAL